MISYQINYQIIKNKNYLHISALINPLEYFQLFSGGLSRVYHKLNLFGYFSAIFSNSFLNKISSSV